MRSYTMENEIMEDRQRRREVTGNTIARLATVFVMVCVIATLIMLVGK